MAGPPVRRGGRWLCRLGWTIGALALLAALLVGVLVLAGRPPAMAVPARGVTLDDVTIVNPERGRLEHRKSVVAGSTIAGIEPASGADSPGAPEEYRGAYVLPGLIDMHVHHPPSFAVRDRQVFHLLYLAYGVTTVRDTGDFGSDAVGLREQISSGKFPGARIFTCGPILDGDPPVWPRSRVVRDADDAVAAVEEVAKAGADCVKVYSNLTPAALHAIESAAQQRGLPVVGHVPVFVSFEDAGIADVQHLTGVPA